MSTLTVINNLPVVSTLSLSLSQIIINENSANNTLSRMTVGNFATQFLPTGELISNAGGTAVGVDLNALLTLSSVGTDGNATLGLTQLSAGELLGNPTTVTGAVEGAGLSLFLDSNFGSVEGGLIYRGPSNWSFLSPGTAGQVLTTDGTAGPPAWESVGVPVVDVIGTAPISVSSSSGTYDVSLTGGLGVELIDGSTTVSAATIITFEGASTLSGGSGHATISVGGGGGGSLEVVGGATTVTSVTEIIFDNATVTGSTGTATVSVGGGGSSWEITDGTHTVSSVTTLDISGGTVSGASGVATLTIASSGSGNGPIWGLNGFTREALSDFTEYAASTAATYTEQSIAPHPLTCFQPNAGTNEWDLRLKTAPTTYPYKIVAMISPQTVANSGYVGQAGIVLQDSTGKFMAFCYTGNGVGWDVSRWNNNTSYSGQYATVGIGVPQWLRATVSSTDILFELSQDGMQWLRHSSNAIEGGGFLGNPTLIGFGINSNGSDTYFSVRNWQQIGP